MLDLHTGGQYRRVRREQVLSPRTIKLVIRPFFFFYLSYHTTLTPQTARAQSEKHCRRRSASSGQKTRRGIEVEKPGRRRYREVLLPEMSLISFFARPISWWRTTLWTRPRLVAGRSAGTRCARYIVYIHVDPSIHLSIYFLSICL